MSAVGGEGGSRRGIVIALVVIVVVLLAFHGTRHPKAASPAATAGGGVLEGQPAGAVVPQPTASTSVTTSTLPALPVTDGQLAAAANAANALLDAYGSYSYTATAQDYAAAISPLCTAALAHSLTASAPPVASLRRHHTVEKATSSATGFTDINSGSVTVAATMRQHEQSTAGDKITVSHWWVTLVPTGGVWVATSLEPAGTGND